MKKILLIVLVFACIFVAYLPAQETKPVLAVLDVSTIGTEESKGKIVYNYILDLINKSGNYLIVERGELDRALEEIEFSSSDLVDDSTAVEIGKLSGADIIVIGSISYVGKQYYLNIKLISVESGEIIGSSIDKAEDATGFYEMCNQAVYKLF